MPRTPVHIICNKCSVKLTDDNSRHIITRVGSYWVCDGCDPETQVTEYTKRLDFIESTHYITTGFGFRPVKIISYFTTSYGKTCATCSDNMNQLHQVPMKDLYCRNDRRCTDCPTPADCGQRGCPRSL